MPRPKKPVSIAEQAQKALQDATKRGETLGATIQLIADCMHQLYQGYQKEQVTPTGEVVVITEYDFKAAAQIGKDLVKLYHELALTSENVPSDDDGVVEFIQQPLLIPVDSQLARAERELLEVRVDDDE
jgi:hypothetical protein